MRQELSGAWSGLLDLIYPPICLVCRSRLAHGALCAACVRDFVPLEPPYCERCGVPVTPESRLCVQCNGGLTASYVWSQALGQYTGPLRTAIHLLKYGGKTALAEPLGLLLARSLDDPPSPLLNPTPGGPPFEFDLVTPIPLHPARRRERGFNQSERIACYLAQDRGWTLDTGSLLRQRRTRTQTTLDASSRAANVQGAFAVRDAAAYAGKSVLLVDDVLTTSATVREAARVICEAGATRVCVVALARD